MPVTKQTLLAVLPPFNNQSILIESAQDVPDIIKEVVNAHGYFAQDYDHIWQFFDHGSLNNICRSLFAFCKKNIDYRVESENEQTTKSPSAILAMGYGDCKHYSAFIAGVLDAISRNSGDPVSWSYRFGSYNMFEKQPGHVFVVVDDGVNEIWIDPCMQSFNDKTQYPFYQIDKKVKTMPLYRVSGVGESVGFIDPATAMTVVKTAADLFSAFGGDKVPNYPIKSQNTLKAIQNDLASQMPLPPVNIESARQYVQYALQKQKEFAAKGGAVDDTKAIMYGEYAEAFQNYINQVTGAPTGGGGLIPSSGILPGGTDKKNLLMPLIAGGAVWFLTKKPVYAIAVAAAAWFFLKPKTVSGVGQPDPAESIAVGSCLY